MDLSDLIDKLKSIRREHGDMTVYLSCQYSGEYIRVDEDCIRVSPGRYESWDDYYPTKGRITFSL